MRMPNSEPMRNDQRMIGECGTGSGTPRTGRAGGLRGLVLSLFTLHERLEGIEVAPCRGVTGVDPQRVVEQPHRALHAAQLEARGGREVAEVRLVRRAREAAQRVRE